LLIIEVVKFMFSQSVKGAPALPDSTYLGTHLFVKVPWPGDSEGTFFGLKSQAATDLYTTNLTIQRWRQSR